MALPHDHADQLLLSLVSPVDLHLENILEDHGVSGQVVDEVLALEWDTFRLCFPAQPAPSALQRCNRRKRAFFLRDLAATADLPLHSALFSQLLLDLTHRWWTEREEPDIDINDVHLLAAAVCIHIELHSARFPDPAPFQLPNPQQPARSLTHLLTAVAALLARRQPHSAPVLHSAWTVQQVITEECRILESVHFELGTPTPAAWIQILEKRLSLWCQQCQPAAVSAVSALAPRARSLWCIGKWRSGHCRRPRPKSAILFGV